MCAKSAYQGRGEIFVKVLSSQNNLSEEPGLWIFHVEFLLLNPCPFWFPRSLVAKCQLTTLECSPSSGCPSSSDPVPTSPVSETSSVGKMKNLSQLSTEHKIFCTNEKNGGFKKCKHVFQKHLNLPFSSPCYHLNLFFCSEAERRQVKYYPHFSL